MSRLRILVVEDEPLARARLRDLLADEPDACIAGECADGPSAVRALHDGAYDLVLLDVEMPGWNGLETLRAVPPERRPPVVFVTAFEQYALEAFEVEALDYLLKPFDRERLRAALERARRALELRRPRGEERLVLGAGKSTVVLRPAEIDWIESAGNYLRLHMGAEVRLVRGTLRGIAERLSEAGFVRIHRSSLVNGARIRELVRRRDGEFLVLLEGGKALLSGRRWRDALERFLAENEATGRRGRSLDVRARGL